MKIYVVADLFCGAGGASTGAQKAIKSIGGKMNLVAINHWNLAIATHQANHPTARHLVEDVSVVDPTDVVEEGYLDILMASPECTFHSRARGGKPIHDQGRMNPWAIHNWLTKLDVRTVLVENVPEFTAWGPLDPDGRPDKNHKGEHFQAWFLTFQSLGYHVEWRMLNAADYGDATTRIRFFLIARKDGRPITWPEPSHAKADGGMFSDRQPWRGAREIIDWANSGRSLMDDPKYRKKPLSEKTRLRIARGLERFGGPLAPLYIRLLDLPEYKLMPENGSHNGNRKAGPFVQANRNNNTAKGIDEPIPTATTAPGGGSYLVQVAAEPFHGIHREGPRVRGIDEPLFTFTTENMGFLIQPEAEPFLLGQQSQGAPRSTDDPAPTITTDGAISLIHPHIIQYYGQSTAQGLDDPLSTIATNNKHGLVNPALIEYYGNSNGADVDQPLPVVTTKARHGLVNPVLVEVNHGNGSQGHNGDLRRSQEVEEPLGSLTTKRGIALAWPCIVPNFGERPGQEPRSHSIEEPAPSITSRGAGNLVEPTMEELQESDVDPRRLVFLDGHPYLLDIKFRMLQNAELARAMGFNDEESTYEFHGNIGEVTKQIGNAVAVNLAAALVKSILGARE